MRLLFARPDAEAVSMIYQVKSIHRLASAANALRKCHLNYKSKVQVKLNKNAQ